MAQDKNRSDDLTGWTVALPRGTVLRPVVESASSLSVATLTLFLRAV